MCICRQKLEVFPFISAELQLITLTLRLKLSLLSLSVIQRNKNKFWCLQYQTPDNQTESQEHDDAQTREMERQEEQDISQQAVLSGVRQRNGRLRRGRRCRGRGLGHLAVNTCPALVALAGELVLHVQDVVVVEVTANVEAGAPGRRVAVDVEEAWVQVQVSARVQALPHTPAILLAQRFAAQLGGRGDVDDIMSQWTINVLLHCQAVSLQEDRDKRPKH